MISLSSLHGPRALRVALVTPCQDAFGPLRGLTIAGTGPSTPSFLCSVRSWRTAHKLPTALRSKPVRPRSGMGLAAGMNSGPPSEAGGPLIQQPGRPGPCNRGKPPYLFPGKRWCGRSPSPQENRLPIVYLYRERGPLSIADSGRDSLRRVLPPQHPGNRKFPYPTTTSCNYCHPRICDVLARYPRYGSYRDGGLHLHQIMQFRPASRRRHIEHPHHGRLHAAPGDLQSDWCHRGAPCGACCSNSVARTSLAMVSGIPVGDNQVIPHDPAPCNPVGDSSSNPGPPRPKTTHPDRAGPQGGTDLVNGHSYRPPCLYRNRDTKRPRTAKSCHSCWPTRPDVVTPYPRRPQLLTATDRYPPDPRSFPPHVTQLRRRRR